MSFLKVLLSVFGLKKSNALTIEDFSDYGEDAEEFFILNQKNEQSNLTLEERKRFDELQLKYWNDILC